MIKKRLAFQINLKLFVHELLDFSVVMDKVSGGIESVPKLCDKNADILPSEATVRNINVRKLALSQLLVNAELPNKSNTILYTAET